MDRLTAKLFLSIAILISLLFFMGFKGSPFAQIKEKSKADVRQPSTYDRIQRAADMGELTLKEAVLLKAKLLFAPSLIPKDSKYAPKPDEGKIQEDCLTGFYKEVHRVFPELNDRERAFLKSLSPDLEAVVAQKEKDQKGPKK